MRLKIGLIVALIIGAAWWTQPPHEPIYEGKPLSWWLHKTDFSDIGFASVDQLRKATGSNGVQWLAWAVEHGQTSIVNNPRAAPPSRIEQIIQTLRQKLFHRRFEDTYDERAAAFEALDSLGSEAAPAIPNLIRLLSDSSDDRVKMAAAVLASIGPPAWPAIERVFHESNRSARIHLLNSLTLTIGSGLPSPTIAEARQMEDFLLGNLRDPDPQIRLVTVSPLISANNLTPNNTAAYAALPALIELLSNPSPSLRAGAAYMINYFGPKASSAIPDLLHLLDDTDPGVRGGAAFALGQIDHDEKQSAARLRMLIHDSDATVRERAENALTALGLDLKQ